MYIKTVGELMKELQNYPSDLKIVGYDGSDRPRPVSLILNEGVPGETDTELMVSTD